MIAHDLALAICRYERIYSTFKPKLSITQLIVMGAVETNKTHAEANMAQRTGLQQEVVRAVVHKLVHKEYVRRTRKSGYKVGRPMEVTATGLRAYEECLALVKRTDAEFFGALSLGSLGDFKFLLQTVTT